MIHRTLALVIVVGSVNLAGCAQDINCSSVGYSDVVGIRLPNSMVDGRTALRMCVDDQCNDEGQLKGLPSVLLTGTILTLDLPDMFEPNRVGPKKSVVRLIATGAISVDTSLKATWRIDHHRGCADSRYIDLRFDTATKTLIEL